MTFASSTSDQGLHERVLTPAAAATAAATTTSTHDASYDFGSTTFAEDPELDREVSRFLESEYFATSTTDAAAAAATAASPVLHSAFLKDELLFMDINEAIDMPDLDYNATPVSQAFDNVHASVDFATATNTTTAPQRPSVMATVPVLPAQPSLRVVIPASALAAPPIPLAAAIPALLPPPQTTGRKRIKYELEYLRQQVRLFESQLAHLKQSTAAGGETSPPSALSALTLHESATFAEPPSQAALWKRIAEHQHAQKQKSELENLKLREMLESQLKVAQSLSRVLRKRQDLSWLDPPRRLGEAAKRHCAGAPSLLASDAASKATGASVFEELSERVETLYAQLDTVLAEAGIAGPETEETQGGEVKTDADGRVYLEVVDVATVPFDIQSTGAAVWKLMSSAHMDFGDVVYEAVDAMDDVVRAVMAVTMRVRQKTTTLRMHTVAKRIVEADRIVHCWCSQGVSDGNVFGTEPVHLRESAWSIIRAASSKRESSTTREPLTVMQYVMHMTPQLDKDDDASAAEDTVGVLTDVCLSSFRQNIATMHQMLENLVLEGATAA